MTVLVIGNGHDNPKRQIGKARFRNHHGRLALVHFGASVRFEIDQPYFARLGIVKEVQSWTR